MRKYKNELQARNINLSVVKNFKNPPKQLEIYNMIVICMLCVIVVIMIRILRKINRCNRNGNLLKLFFFKLRV